MNIQYRGLLISDTCIPGEGKSQGITPEISACVQASRDKWLIVFGTLDPRGWDTNRSILYQIRNAAPDGTVIKEGIIEKARSGWDPLGAGHRFRKVNAVPKVFGVPKGALRHGKPIPTANHFVVNWFVRPCLEIGGLLANNFNDERWPPDVDITDYDKNPQCLEWMQFRLNDAEDDIEIISPAQRLCQKGYENGPTLSSIAPAVRTHYAQHRIRMHHGFGDAAACNDDYSEWIEVCHFEDKMAAIRYAFDPDSGLYEWVQTGKPQHIGHRQIGESSLNRINNDWVISVRGYDEQGQTAWYKTSDPFESFGDRTDIPCSYVPRISYRCADGILRLFSNDQELSPYKDSRNPLYCFDVDPTNFSYSNRQVVLDSRKEGLPFYMPFVDHAMLYPYAGGKKQIVSFRVITHKQTKQQAQDPDVTPEELEKSGVHYCELLYDQEYAVPWEFEAKC